MVSLVYSCGKATNSDQKTSEHEMVGNDKDAHGCIGSAGYTWSQLNKDCIRVFEIGKRLNSVTKDETSSAFYVYNLEKTKIEMFLPQSNSSILLLKTKTDTYTFENYELDTNKGIFTINGAIKYRDSID